MPLTSIKRRFATVGSALSYCVRVTTPIALGFALLTIFFEIWGASRLPGWLERAGSTFGRDLAWSSLLIAFSLTAISLLGCLPALLLASDGPLRNSRALAWCIAINLLALALELVLALQPVVNAARESF